MKITRCAILVAAGFALAASLLSAQPAQAGKGFPLAAEGEAFAARQMSAFARESLTSFSTFELSNGIPVVVKLNPANRVQHLSLVIRGGALAATPETAGYEALALKTMARGSAGFSYEDIQSLLDETSSGIGSESNFEYSAFTLNTLDKYFDRLFPVWADAVTAPSFPRDGFDQELSQAKLALQSKEQNPWAKTGLVVNGIFFAGHPYAIAPEGTKESLGAATPDAALAWYKASMRAGRLFIVAVGDFDPASLRGKLESALGGLPPGGGAPAAVAPAFVRSGPGTLTSYEFPASKGVGYVRGDFAAPAPADPDFMSANLAMEVLSDLMYSVITDKYGATYTPNAYIRAVGANYGSLTIYKTKVPGKVKAYIDESVALLAKGKAMSTDPTLPDDGAGRVPLAEVMDSYKAQYVNKLFESQQTNAAVATRIVQSVVAYGDYRTWLLDSDRVRAVTAEQVSAATAKYLLPGSLAWVALGSADVLIPVSTVDYEGFDLDR
jgi:zinc protease